MGRRPHGYYYAKHTFNHMMSNYQKQKKRDSQNVLHSAPSDKQMSNKEVIIWLLSIIAIFALLCYLSATSYAFGSVMVIICFLTFNGVGWFLGFAFLLCLLFGH